MEKNNTNTSEDCTVSMQGTYKPYKEVLPVPARYRLELASFNERLTLTAYRVTLAQASWIVEELGRIEARINKEESK